MVASAGAAGQGTQQQQQQAAGEEGDCCNENDEEEEEQEGVWDPSRDPLPPTLDVTFTCGDVVEEGAEGFEVLLLVSAAFTDALLQTVARALEPLPVGTMVRFVWVVCGIRPSCSFLC